MSTLAKSLMKIMVIIKIIKTMTVTLAMIITIIVIDGFWWCYQNEYLVHHHSRSTVKSSHC